MKSCLGGGWGGGGVSILVSGIGSFMNYQEKRGISHPNLPQKTL